MRTRTQRWTPGGLPLLRSGVLLLIPPLLLALQMLVVGPRLPQAARVGGEREGAVAFSVISIEPARSSRHRGISSRRPALEEEEEAAARAYEDENEVHARQVSIARGSKFKSRYYYYYWITRLGRNQPLTHSSTSN